MDDLVETDKLRHTTLDVMSLKECRYRWQGGSDATSSDSSGATEIIPSMLCAIRANTTSCYGDSGGECIDLDIKKNRKSQSYEG